jgi:predicted RNase H-like nuclease (RuvC/YqgF family)
VYGGIVAALVLMTGIVLAQSVNDYKDAAEKSGCGLIVYSSERSTCDDRGPRIDDYCKTRTWSCDGLDPEGLKKNIEGVKQKIESLKKERDELQNKKSSAKDDSEKRDLEDKISDKEKEIRTLEDKVTEWERKIDDEKKEIRNRLSVGKQCKDYRVDVQKAFADAKYKFERESSPEIKPFAEKIVKKIESEESGHKTAIEIVQRGIEKCDRM